MKLNTAYRYTVALMLLMCAVLAFGSCAASLMDEDKAVVKKDKEPKKEAKKEAPTTETPTTEKPTTEKPTTEAPTTEAPTTEEPKKETQNEMKEVIVNDADINDDSRDSSDNSRSNVGRDSEAVGQDSSVRTDSPKAESTDRLAAEESNEDNTVTSQGRSLDVLATYYLATCEGCSGITATGLDVRSNWMPNGLRVIAVDPSVVPLGTVVTVKTPYESFKAVAGDTGGAIVGNKIDILAPDLAFAQAKGGKVNAVVTY